MWQGEEGNGEIVCGGRECGRWRDNVERVCGKGFAGGGGREGGRGVGGVVLARRGRRGGGRQGRGSPRSSILM